MAFTGAAVVKQVTDGLVRISGLSLAEGDDGTIGLFGDSTADVQLPEGFLPTEYSRSDGSGPVTLFDSVQCWWVAVGVGGADFIVSKGSPPFQITFDYGGASEAASAEMEIYVRYH